MKGLNWVISANGGEYYEPLPKDSVCYNCGKLIAHYDEYIRTEDGKKNFHNRCTVMISANKAKRIYDVIRSVIDRKDFTEQCKRLWNELNQEDNKTPS